MPTTTLRRRRRGVRLVIAAVTLAAAFVLGAVTPNPAGAGPAAAKRYIVIFDATEKRNGGYALGGDYALNKQYALNLLKDAGATMTMNLLKELAIAIVESPNYALGDTLEQYALVDQVVEDFDWQTVPSYAEAIADGSLNLVAPGAGGGPDPSADPLEPLQWNMQLIRTEKAHAAQAGSNAVDVGIIDTGIDAAHADFVDPTGNVTNVDCLRGRDFVVLVGPGVGNPVPCVDNNFHGTHVAGIVAAQANGVGVVGVAPNVTLVPIKVCDADGHCYATTSVAGIAYAGLAKLDVVNMSFFVDDDEFQASTEVKCKTDEQQWGFRNAVYRAVRYAVGQGVTPVAAAGNSNTDLGATGPDCDVVPAEIDGVVTVSAVGPQDESSYYTSFGAGPLDVAAPGGDWLANLADPCGYQVPSTIPGNLYGCFEGTSMASPHVAGVAALIESQFGSLGADGDVRMLPINVLRQIRATSIDLGTSGYDKCFGAGRVDAVRAVHDKRTVVAKPSALTC